MYIEELHFEVLKERRIERLQQKSVPFYNFNLNLSGALLLTTLKHGPESDNDYGSINMLLLQNLAITQVITSLETYYREVIITITNNIKTIDVEPSALSRFIIKNAIVLAYSIEKQIHKKYPIERIKELYPQRIL